MTPLKTILLVEDNEDDELLTIDALKKGNIGNHIDVVRDGAEALDFLRCLGQFKDREPSLPQLVLLDLKLPKLSGLEVLQQIRSDPQLRRLPVVILTSSTEEEDVVRGYDLGVNSYVCKPVGLDEFNSAVQQLGMYWLLLNEPPASRGHL